MQHPTPYILDSLFRDVFSVSHQLKIQFHIRNVWIETAKPDWRAISILVQKSFLSSLYQHSVMKIKNLGLACFTFRRQCQPFSHLREQLFLLQVFGLIPKILHCHSDSQSLFRKRFSLLFSSFLDIAQIQRYF